MNKGTCSFFHRHDLYMLVQTLVWSNRLQPSVAGICPVITASWLETHIVPGTLALLPVSIYLMFPANSIGNLTIKQR